MDKKQAQNLIKETFENSFDKDKFVRFIKNLLNKIQDSSFVYRGNYIPEAYRQYINTVERIGKYSDGEHTVDLLIITLKKETSLERARTMQRNFVAWYLNGSRGGEMKDAALVAYVSPSEDDWRFSLVKMDYRFEKTKTGKMKVKEEFTPARRWSFLVGSNEKSHTAQSRLVKLLADDKSFPTLQELETGFDIETVTNEFFLKYRELFLRTKDELDKVLKKNPQVEADFDAKGVDTVNFAKKLLGQIVFLYFLQKKGWFGVERDSDWGTGTKHFLRELFEKKHSDYNNFYNDILEPLFYESLRIDRSHDDDYYSRFNCKIPFLNGGLFDPIGNYDWVHTDINLPNELFSNRRKTREGDIGDGILDVFDRYNFTVREDEPLEREVAIDPELLGKAYEKFNAIRSDNFDEFKKVLKRGKKGEETEFNKKFGVYYTPREIVHYMCKQSLIYFLVTELVGKVTKEDIEILVQTGDQISQNEEAAFIKESNIKNGRQKSTRIVSKLPESVRHNANLIDKALANIRVCDPAVGSGAFPVGMMHEIVNIRNVLSAFLNDRNRNIYEFKRRCIEHSIYGVDIDPGAVEIAKLRLWLSLIVDEDDYKNIKPLPNLDYKIVCGNSLLAYPYTPVGLENIEKLKEIYLEEVKPSQKNELRKQIDNAIYGLFRNTEKNLGYRVSMDYKINFSEVFREKGGFNIVIANPPYVRADNPEIKEQRQSIMQSRIYETLYEKWDLYVAFIERGFQILNTGGVLEYIVPDAYISSKYATKSHDYFLKNATISRVNFLNDIKVFEAAVKNIIIEFKKIPNPQNVTLKIKHLEKFANFIELPSGTQEEMGELTFNPESSNRIVGKLNNTVKWGEICYVSYGLRPSSDERYWKGEFTKDDLISDYKDNIHSRPYIEGKWINNYEIEKIKYLEWDTDRSPKKLVRPTFPELYIPSKIMMGGMTGAIFDNSGLLCNHSITISVLWKDLRGVNNKSISGSIKKDFKVQNVSDFREILEEESEGFELKYLLSILNSKLGKYYLSKVRRSQIGFYPDDLKKIPIQKISKNRQKPFIELVNKILNITKVEDYPSNSQKLEKVKALKYEIDQKVYELYGLTEEEIRIVEGSNIEK